MPKEDKEIVVSQGNAPAQLIRQALSSGADLDKLNGLLDLQLKWEANEARKAYVEAMAKFKADPPEINKDQSVSFNNTSYKHASLANVTSKINSALSEHGLSASWSTSQDGKGISVTCTITHDMGHSESTTLTADADDSGKKNKIQAIGSTVTYLERYTILALTGLATHEAEDDGRGSEVEYITEEQENELHSMIIDNELGEKYIPTFCKFCKVESLSEIEAKNFNKAKASLNSVIAQVKK
jgi:hypothetical protein